MSYARIDSFSPRGPLHAAGEVTIDSFWSFKGKVNGQSYRRKIVNRSDLYL